jgi:hypothetical protein
MPGNYMDHLKEALRKGWQHFFDALHPDHHQQLLKMLRDAYLEEAQDVVQFTRHADRMHYPQFRERLLRIAAEEQAHLTWLRDKLLALGGEIPAASLKGRKKCLGSTARGSGRGKALLCGPFGGDAHR